MQNPLNIQVEQLINDYHRLNNVYIGLSGGVDSMVLLDLFIKNNLTKKLIAVHFNHNLQPDFAKQCKQLCEKFCFKHAVKLKIINITPNPKINTQNHARTLRLNAYAKLMQAGDGLFLAHHSDDQSETILQKLFKGSGIKGLKGMSYVKKIQQISIYRPLLSVNKDQIYAYAKTHLNWVEDPSNLLTKYERNNIRHSVLSTVKKYWPAINKTLSQFSGQMHEHDLNLLDLAKIDGLKDNYVDLDNYKNLTPARQKNLLFYFLAQQNMRNVYKVINTHYTKIDKANYKFSLGANFVCNYQKKLYFVNGANQACFSKEISIYDKQVDFLQHKIIIEPGFGFVINKNDKVVISNNYFGKKIITSSGKHKWVKKVFQEQNVPVWERTNMPLLFINDVLVGIIGCYIPKFLQKESGVSFKLAKQ